MFRSTNGGDTISQISVWSPSPGQGDIYVHSDVHNLIFSPSNPNTLFVVCDGGIFKSADGGSTFEDLNNGLGITQFYGVGIHPDGNRAAGGTQDNGTLQWIGDDVHWFSWSGGDGGYTAWDQQNPNFVYGSRPNGTMFRSTNGGSSSANIPLPSRTGSQFIQPFTLDSNDGARLMVGTNTVFFTSDARAATVNWQSTGPSFGVSVSAVSFSPHDTTIAYVGTVAGRVYRIDQLGTGNNRTEITNNIPTGPDITRIVVAPYDSSGQTLFVTRADFGADRIFKSTDAGQNWQSIQGNLPVVPLLDVTVDPTNDDRLFLASEIGLFVTENHNNGTATSWLIYDYGPAFTRLIQLRWSDDDTLWIGTHGRGLYRARRNASRVSLGTLIDPDCDTDNFIDAGETVMLPITVTNLSGDALNNASLSLMDDHPNLTISNPTQALASIPGNGEVVQNFELSLDSLAACLTAANLTVQISHSGGTYETVFPITLGANPDEQTGTYSEDAEGATLLSGTALLGNNDWAQVTTQASTGAQSWFASDEGNYADKQLTSPWLEVMNNPVISFDLFYHFEADANQPWDGAVLEMRTENSGWFDIGNQSTVAYDGQLFTNSILNRQLAWTGDQRSWRSATVSLGSQYNGQRIQFRFRIVCDGGTSVNGGLWVDDLSVTNVRWLAGLECDSQTCITCLNSVNDAVNAILTSLGNDEWTNSKSVTDYVETLTNICTP